MPRRVLVVDDDREIRLSVSEALRADGFEVVVAESGAAALGLLDAARPDVVISDVRMDDIDGLALLRTLRNRAEAIDVILMTAFDDMPTIVSAMRDGAVDFLVKPFDVVELRGLLHRVFEDRRTRRLRANGGPGESALSLTELVGRTPAMLTMYKLIGQTASTRANVLIRGESGTGKELVARAIHENGSDADQPMVAVNCAAVPSTLLESELFGHVRGAFTGAASARRGSFAQAGRGTVFLDEIGDTSLDFQSKILRVLQNREYQPVGAERIERTEARVIAATHQDLESMIEARRFREDLYYRLRVVEIVVPPLRERKADIPQLAEHMIRKAAQSLASSHPVLSPEALRALTAYDWPGNVRELENCLMRAVVLASGSVIRPDHLSMSSPKSPRPAVVALGEVERDHVARALAETAGNKSRAADLLQISRPRLARLIAKYNLADD